MPLSEDGNVLLDINTTFFLEQILKERDSALARAEAYREVAFKRLDESKFHFYEDMYQEVDAEAARILSQRKGGE